MQPCAIIPFIFLFVAQAVRAQDTPAAQPTRALDESAESGKLPESGAAKPGKPASSKINPAPAKPAGPASGASSDAGAAMNAAALLPVGVPSYNVRMPEFDEERLLSRMKVRELTRIDSDHLDLRDMDLERYLPSGALDYVVLVERGFYEMSTGRLVSSSPTRLRGKSIDLHGEGCVYSRDSEVIKILGKVTSYIYAEKDQSEKPKEEEPAKETGEGPKPSTGAKKNNP